MYESPRSSLLGYYVQQVSDKFRKREFVIVSTEKGAEGRDFTDYIKFQCIQERCELINESFLNENVKVSFNIKGKRWEKDGRVSYFTNLDAWRIEKAEAGKTDDAGFPAPPLPDDMPPSNEDYEDLPF